MRARIVLLVAAILLVAAFTALNWSDFIKPTPLSFGVTVADAPLGLILLVLMTGVLVAFVLSSALIDSRHIAAEREYHRELKAQRELAEKAEASRFAELRQHIDAQAREAREREAATTAALDRMLVSSHHDLQSKVQALSSDVEHRLDTIDHRLSELRERTRRQIEVV